MQNYSGDLLDKEKASDDTWIASNLKTYKKLYITYKGMGEKALAACAFSYIKILNSIIGMDYSQFHYYEKTMLWDAMKLFSQQCQEQLEKSAKCKDIHEKKELIDDIERSILKVFEVYRNIVDGTGEMNRQIIQNTSIDTSMYELSPKVSAYFSRVLENLRNLIYNTNQLEYAFILIPSLCSRIHAEVLLEKKNTSGKVVIVYIPENAVDNFPLITVSLVHEGFHILTKSQRMRKYRALQFIKSVKICLDEMLLRDLDVEDSIKNHISSNWYSDIDEWGEQLSQESEDSKIFYGKEFCYDVGSRIGECLQKIFVQLQDNTLDLVISYLDNFHNRHYEEFQQKYNDIFDISKMLRKKVFYLASGDKIGNIVNVLMDLYKETYADMACILMLEISPRVYEKSFSDSISFKYDFNEYYGRMEQNIRALLVADAVRSHFIDDKKSEWNQFYDRLMKEYKVNMCDMAKRSNEESVLRKQYMFFSPSSELLSCFRDYLYVCSNCFSYLLREIKNIKEFRSEINSLLDSKMEKSLITILKGVQLKILMGDYINEDSN